MISVIIVTYNSRQHIARCLESLQGSGAEIVVVDNASADGTAELVRETIPGVKLIVSQRNLGFAGGANLGAQQSRGTALLFANPDTVCHCSLTLLEDALERSPGIVAAAPRLVDAQGRTQTGFHLRRLPTMASLIFEVLGINRLFPNNPVNRRYRCLDLDPALPAEVEQPAGAFLLVRRTSFESCGGFDDGFYPLWFDDVDLCLRLRRGGGRIVYCPEAVVEHSGAHSLESVSFSDRQVYWYRNLLYYVRKHFRFPAGVVIRAAVLMGIVLRLVAELPGLLMPSQTRTQARGEKICAYWKAAKLSVSGWK